MRLTDKNRKLIEVTLNELHERRPTFCALVRSLLEDHPMSPPVSGDELDRELAKRAEATIRAIGPLDSNANIFLALVRMEANQREIREAIDELRLAQD